MTTIPPHVLAAGDQLRAAANDHLNQLIDQARQHIAEGCQDAGTWCPGPSVLTGIAFADDRENALALMVAVYRLATQEAAR